MEPIGRSPIAPPLLIAGKIAMAACWLFPLAAQYGLFPTMVDSRLTRAAGMVLYGCGIVLAALSFTFLGKSVSVGLPRAETELKTGGVYRVSRNPMYLAGFLACAGSCCIAVHPLNLFLCAVTVAIHHRIVLSEEKFLEARFGQAYVGYRNRVLRYAGRRRAAPGA